MINTRPNNYLLYLILFFSYYIFEANELKVINQKIDIDKNILILLVLIRFNMVFRILIQNLEK